MKKTPKENSCQKKRAPISIEVLIGSTNKSMKPSEFKREMN